MKAGRVLLLVFGSLTALVAIGLVASGGLLLWFNSERTDGEGYYTTEQRRFESTSHAIVSEGIDINLDIPEWVEDWWFDPHNFTNVKLAASNNDPAKEVFIGLARESDVKAYLAGVEYDEIVKLHYNPFGSDFSVDYSRHEGGSPPADPMSQAFWKVSTHGAGTQVLKEPLETGVWSVVVMNADGSAGVDVDGSFGMSVPFVFRTGLGLLLGGVFTFVIAGGMIFLGARRPSSAPRPMRVADRSTEEHATRERSGGKSMNQSTSSKLELSFTGRVAGWSARHRWIVVLGAVALFVISFLLSGSIGVKTSDVTGTGESREAAQLIEDRFEKLPSFESVVIKNPNLDVDDEAFRSTVEPLVEELRGLDGVADVESYYESRAPHLVSDDRHVVIARVELEKAEQDELNDFADGVMDAVLEAGTSAAAGGFELGVLGGASLNVASEEVANEDFGKIMIIAVIGGLIILILAFGAVVAALIPIGIALVSIFTAVGVATITSQAKPLNFYFYEMIILMGLAVGIDYSLFIINRFREERAAGRPKLEAIQVCCDTTGRAVLYAGITVFVSLAGMLLTGDALFYGLGMGAMIVVVLAIVASLTLLPALISLLDHRMNWLRIPGLGRPATGGGVWGKITDEVLARPVIYAGVTIVALIALSVPLLSLNIGDTPITKVFDWDGAVGDTGKIGGLARGVNIMDEHFILGEADGLVVIVDPGKGDAVNTPAIQASTANLIAAVGQDDQFGQPVETIVNIQGDLLGILVPVTDVEDTSKANAAVEKLRELAPAAFARAGVDVYVAGSPASTFDSEANTKTKAPLVVGFVLIMAFLLLLVMFRSIAIPIKAIILNLLSVGAAMGVMVLVFQEGVGEGLLSFESAGTIEIFMPLFLFAVLFGLSMDYHMLVLNRVKEAYDAGSSNEESVSLGIKATAALITSAAIVMVLVFGAFATSRIMFFKQIGVGLGVAIFIDATIIRAILLPASMKLLGDWNWYLPSWLEWLPRISAEGEREVEAAALGD
jgi:uncharacterized membrane protein YdfJ with MMPL/SSD domain